MTAPESWLLIEAVAERLRAIKMADGYRTDAGLDVITEHAELKDAQQEAPQLLVFTDGEIGKAASSCRKWTDWVLPLTAQCRFPLSHARAQRQAHDVMADINQALPANAAQLTADEFAFELKTLGILQRPTGADTVVVQATLSASYRVLTP